MVEKNEVVEVEKVLKKVVVFKVVVEKKIVEKKFVVKKVLVKIVVFDVKVDFVVKFVVKKVVLKKDVLVFCFGVLKVYYLCFVFGVNIVKICVGCGEGLKGKIVGCGIKGIKVCNIVCVGFEGGQMLLYMCILKLCGFKNLFCVEYQVVNLEKFVELYLQGGDVIIGDLVVKGVVCKNEKVKVFGNGDIVVKFIVLVDKVLGFVEQKIVVVGGFVK